MRHYEVVFLVHPDQSEQVPAMVERLKTRIQETGGQVHRLEDWGRRQMAYQIEKVGKAHYILMNVECEADVMDEITNGFRFNDAVLRNMVIKLNEAELEPSAILKSKERENSRYSDRSPRPQASAPAAKPAADSAEQATGTED